MRITVQKITVHTKRTFAIARGAHDAFERVILTLIESGATGRGEAAPTAHYGQDADNAAEALRTVRVEDPWDIEGTLAANGHLPPASKAALDAALHDLAAKRLGVPVYRQIGRAHV